ncbi:hypothetical protein [Pajaroellobacter abortibovis]|uniref:hypothetical protein n=1 Tax=Pajaroellobacter abortibovis TaxID=1882918 RepID=UPI0012EC1707|nr:hypothetical protein [Pajaroellobacter abortibovis]
MAQSIARSSDVYLHRRRLSVDPFHPLTYEIFSTEVTTHISIFPTVPAKLPNYAVLLELNFALTAQMLLKKLRRVSLHPDCK